MTYRRRLYASDARRTNDRFRGIGSFPTTGSENDRLAPPPLGPQFLDEIQYADF